MFDLHPLLACRWNRKIYYIGDGWKENGIDFYCVEEKVRPGCYVERHGAVATCTGAIAGKNSIMERALSFFFFLQILVKYISGTNVKHFRKCLKGRAMLPEFG